MYSWVADAAAGIKISSARVDAELNGMAAGLSNCITRDGQSTPVADLPMGGHKLTGLGVAAVGTDALSRDAADARYVQPGGAISATTVNATGDIATTGNVSGAAGLFSAGVSSVGLVISTGGNAGVSLADRSAGATWVMYANGGGLKFYNGADRVAVDATGSLSARDLTATRGDGTGVVFLNDARTRNLYFDGANYNLPGASLLVNGSQAWTAATLNPGLYAPLAGANFSGPVSASAMAATTINAGTVSLGNGYALTVANGRLSFTYNGSPVVSIDASGNIRSAANFTASTTP